MNKLPEIGSKVIMKGSQFKNDFLQELGDIECEIIAHSTVEFGDIDVAVFKYTSEEGYELFHGCVAECFEPIQSDHLALIDELTEIINSVGAANHGNSRYIATKVVSKGWRPTNDD